MSLVLQSSGGGSVTINEPTTASNFTQTLPAATGTVMVSGNMPAFRASASTPQSIAGSTNTKITLDVEIFDTNNNFASSRFTPTVAGYYLFAGQGTLNVSTNNSTIFVQIMKNGLSIGSNAAAGTASSYPSSHITSLTYMNGTTDYVELYIQTNSGTLSTVNTVFSTYDATYFQGLLVRAA